MNNEEDRARLICRCGNIQKFPYDTMRFMPDTEPCEKCGEEDWSSYGEQVSP